MAVYVKPAFGKSYDSVEAVKEAWRAGVTFRMQKEFYAYVDSRDWEKYGNKMDSVIYAWDGLHIVLERGIL